MSLILDVECAQEVGRLLYQAYHTDGIFGHRAVPGHALPQGVQRGGRTHLHFITLTVSINYQRDADSLWKASRKTFADEQTQYLYDPISVVKAGFDKVKVDMQRYNLSRKTTKDPGIWTHICDTLVKHFDGDVYRLLESTSFNAPKILATLRNRRYVFPYLKGLKIGSQWIRLLENTWQGHHLIDLDHVPIPIDRHIAAASVMTGCITGAEEHTVKRLRKWVIKVWDDACKGEIYYPLQFDEPLWHLSKYGCRKTQRFPCQYRKQCSVSHFCTEIEIAS